MKESSISQEEWTEIRPKKNPKVEQVWKVSSAFIGGREYQLRRTIACDCVWLSGPDIPLDLCGWDCDVDLPTFGNAMKKRKAARQIEDNLSNLWKARLIWDNCKQLLRGR